MSCKQEYWFSCGKCHEVFQWESDSVINATDEPELKKSLFCGDFFLSECPHCNKRGTSLHPLRYIDNFLKIEVNYAPLGDLMEEYNESVKVSEDGWSRVGVVDHKDIVSKILMLEHGIDHRLGQIYLLSVFLEEFDMLEDGEYKPDTDSPCSLAGTYFCLDGHELAVMSDIVSEKGESFQSVQNFSMDIFEIIFNKYSKFLDTMPPYLFDKETAIKFYDEDMEIEDDYFVEVAIYQNICLSDGDEGEMAYVPKFKEGEFQVGDVVIVMKDRNMVTGYITNLFKLNILECPRSLNDLGVVAYKKKRMDVEPLDVPLEALDNRKLLDEIYEMLNIKQSYTPAMKGAKVIASFEKPTHDCSSEDDYYDVGENEGNFVVDDVLLSGQYYETEDKNYLKVYLSEDDVPGNVDNPVVVSFDELTEYCLNYLDIFDGIVINPEKDEIILSNEMLSEYKVSKYLLDEDAAKNLLLELTCDEIEYMGQLPYELVCYAYNNDTNPNNMAKVFEISKNNVHKALQQGYTRLRHIILDNY